MKVSIITVCYNSEKTIADTLESVQIQDYPNIELIVIDGQSADGTLAIIEKYKSIVSKSVSEPDNGIYDAMNKGIKLATGDIIGILNSDDVFANNNVVSKIVDAFKKNPDTYCTYGDLIYVDKAKSKIKRYWKARAGSINDFYKGWAPPHPTFYVRKNVFDICGYYTTDFEVVADYEFMLRVMVKHQLKATYIPHILVWMRVGGKSNESLKNRRQSFMDSYLAWEKNGLKPKYYTIYLKMACKIYQYFNHKIDKKPLH